MHCSLQSVSLIVFRRLLVFSREWMRGSGIGGRLEEGEDEAEHRKKYQALCDGLWSLLPTLVSSPVSRYRAAFFHIHFTSIDIPAA